MIRLRSITGEEVPIASSSADSRFDFTSSRPSGHSTAADTMDSDGATDGVRSRNASMNESGFGVLRSHSFRSGGTTVNIASVAEDPFMRNPYEISGTLPPNVHPWEFAGWGEFQTISDLGAASPSMYGTSRSSTSDLATKLSDTDESPSTPLMAAESRNPVAPVNAKPHKLLGQFAATAISGNDITSSCLYVAGIAALNGGKWAPISLALVCAVLYLFRSIYSEVVTALPVNGGTYTLLLNTTTKGVAALAACLTLLSYVSTAVMSATEAMWYLHHLWSGLNIDAATIGVLAFFAILTIIGVTESAPVAIFIFVTHLVTLAILIVSCFVQAVQNDWQILRDNLKLTRVDGYWENNVGASLFYGFSTGMLGISGFETSANFVEEQKPGVFVKTLRNMWLAVTFLNPLISFLAMCVLPLSEVMKADKVLLEEMASHDWLKKLVSVDATLVLSGAVLTSYVGVSGLIRRLALDRCLPSVLLTTNRLTGTNHVIVLIFFAICTSLYFITEGDTLVLSGIYTLSFLSVMALFALGNIIMKYKRSSVARAVVANPVAVLVAFLAVVAAIVGTIIKSPRDVEYFVIYYTATVVIVVVMFQRKRLLKILLTWLRPMEGRPPPVTRWAKFIEWLAARAVVSMQGLCAQQIVFLLKEPDVVLMNKVALYIRDNEDSSWIKFVHIYDRDDNIPSSFIEYTHFLDMVYPKMRFDFVAAKGAFDHETLAQLSQRLNIPLHFFFIAAPGKDFKLDLAKLGGVRLITH
eukprot:Opistho-2@54254